MDLAIPQKWSGTPEKLVALATISILVALLTIFCLANNIQVVFTHLYYIPIILASYWFTRKGVIYSALISAFYLGAVMTLGAADPSTILAAVARVIVFIGISLVIAVFSIILKRQQEKITRSEEQFRGIWESIQAGIILVDAKNNTIIAANPQALKITGFSETEMVGQLYPRFTCPADMGTCPASDLEKKVDQAECELLSHDGTWIPVLKTVTEMQVGEEKYYIENVIDISRRKEAENALLAYVREATLRIRNPVELVRDNLHDIHEELKGHDTTPAYIVTSMVVQEKNLEEILNNLKEIERAVAEKRTEIPDAFREYLKR
jgi:PAS domain S-box-containing protein